MKKSDFNSYLNKIDSLLSTGQISQIFLLKDGRLLKLFNSFQFFLQLGGVELEKMLLESEFCEMSSSIKRPLEILYQNGVFVGYIMERARGISLNQRNKQLSLSDRADLYKYATIHANLEKIIKESKGVVFPDLLTCDNIFIDDELNIELIDVDGMQIGNNILDITSTGLGSNEDLKQSHKYYNPQTGLFTKQLDLKSLIHLYFLNTFEIDLSKVGKINPQTETVITLEDIFELIRLDDWDLMDKVWKVFQENKQNEYLGEDIYRIAENYYMDLFFNPLNGKYLKRLRNK